MNLKFSWRPHGSEARKASQHLLRTRRPPPLPGLGCSTRDEGVPQGVYKVQLPGPHPEFKLGVSGMELSKPSPEDSWDRTGPAPISNNTPGLYDVCQGAARQGLFLGFITWLPTSTPRHRQVWNGSH